jgi:hypothetical protein
VHIPDIRELSTSYWYSCPAEAMAAAVVAAETLQYILHNAYHGTWVRQRGGVRIAILGTVNVGYSLVAQYSRVLRWLPAIAISSQQWSGRGLQELLTYLIRLYQEHVAACIFNIFQAHPLLRNLLIGRGLAECAYRGTRAVYAFVQCFSVALTLPPYLPSSLPPFVSSSLPLLGKSTCTCT